MSGFLTAIQKFGAELSDEETAITSLAYQNFQIELEDTPSIRAALILKGPPTNLILNKMKTFVQKFELQFKDAIQNFKGNVTVFNSAGTLAKDIFG